MGVLSELASRWGTVAVVSGRPVAFLAEHLGGSGATVFHGLYGLERANASGGVETDPAAAAWRAAVDSAATEAEAELGPGAVERKGLTVTLHYRTDPGREAEVTRLAAGLAGRSGLVAHDAKMSVELRPPVRTDKGTVLRQSAAGLVAVAFAGDDLGDLPAYAVLAELRAAGVATLSIAAGGDETPPAVLEVADLTVEGPSGIIEVLRQLVGR